jgi:tetratricopeptide (TPR) repeat protein
MYKWRHNKKWVFYSLFLLITLLPVSQIMPTTTLFAERYLYLASIPFCILLSESVVWITSRLDTKWRQQILVGIVGLLVVMYGLRTIIRNQVWTNSYTLWSLAYKDTPNSTIVLSNLGVYYAQKGEFDQALPYFQKAAELHPDSVPVQLNLANTYHKLGRDELWLIHLKTADEIQKNGN